MLRPSAERHSDPFSSAQTTRITFALSAVPSRKIFRLTRRLQPTLIRFLINILSVVVTSLLTFTRIGGQADYLPDPSVIDSI